MVTFGADQAVDALQPLDTVERICSLLSLLCGEQICLTEPTPAREAVIGILRHAHDIGADKLSMNYEEFNELLLIFNQYRVERPFFEFFFAQEDPRKEEASKKQSILFSELPAGVTRFRGFALLCYGNFRFGYRELSKISDPAIFMNKLEPWNVDSSEEQKKIRNRKEALLQLAGTRDEISKDQTPWLGYLTGDRLENDHALFRAIAAKAYDLRESEAVSEIGDVRLVEKINKLWPAIKDEQVDRFNNHISRLEGIVTRKREEAVQARERGIRNTLKYLTWDYLDVYIATSMRHEWEFEETFTFVKEVFEERLSKRNNLPLRWFDPTQSYDPNLIDKGLLEGLMLKRAKCCIYMAQECDTLGKDSELAATLAQGKPVIAYVRRIDKEDLQDEIEQMKRRPFRYFRQRLTYLLSDTFFEKPDNRSNICTALAQLEMPLSEDKFREIVENFLKLLYDFESERSFELISDEEAEYRKAHEAKFRRLEKFMAAVESVAANNRAKTLQARHPLSMQVNLQTGVANGVFVTRDYADCARVIEGVLTRSLRFAIREEVDEIGQSLGTSLRESHTNSKFRIVTANECLTNSFWNFYLES
ncbi:hypothetical protein ACFQH5_17965 [Halomonas salifodinae]|uniref:Uncharacterized protein n=1 Tax=Halomonas salifodinae TaxID=438745 RepID=A0ABW2F088_9GAMM